MWQQIFSATEPETVRDALLAATGLIIIAVAREIAECLVRSLKRIEVKLDRNTRETIRARRQATKAAEVVEARHAAQSRAGDLPSTPQPESAPTSHD
jgi:hypothetical protein